MIKPYYQDESCTIYHGDAREILPRLQKGLIVTDPPYGIDLALGMGGGKKGSGGMWKGVKIKGDENISVRDEVLDMFSAFAAFGSPRVSWPLNTKSVLVWDKGEHTGAGDLSFPWKPSFEFIFIAGSGWKSTKRTGGVIRVNAVAGCVGNDNKGMRYHPFEKPVAICGHLIARHESNLIIDPFMGSGTTLRAAKDLGRSAIGIELEEKYCEIAAKRLRQEVLEFS